ncbi:MAG: Holliday junction resolvase RuvX [Phycisphaerae bacterium]
MIRWIAVDYGTKRIGLAVGDQISAAPVEPVAASGQPARDAATVRASADHYDSTGFVVGLPLNMDGTNGPQAELSRRFAEHLVRGESRPVEMWDERLSSFQADEWMREADIPAARRRELRDSLAALAILRSFLASRRAD